MTFEQFRLSHVHDINHPPRKVETPKFIRHQGRVFEVLEHNNHTLKVKSISGLVKTKILHELDLD